MDKIDYMFLQRLDRALEGRLPEGFREGIHLVSQYVDRHGARRLREMDAFRQVRDRARMELSPEMILELYRVLTAGTELEGRGWKTENSYLSFEEEFYVTLPAEETPRAMEELCRKYRHLNDTARLQEDPEAFDDIFRFILDFICIHPFSDGNGRMSVFLSQALLRNAGLDQAAYLPLDYLQHIKYDNALHLHIVKASGIFYGQKDMEYGLYVAFMKGLVKEGYELLTRAVEEV